MIEISVIIPVFNAEKFLEKCIMSVRAQTMPDWELILINDGSTDTSPEICRLWSQRDSRIRVLEQANGGVSSARNAGLDVSQGEYVFFLDSDDTLFPTALESLLSTARHYGAQIAEGGMLCVEETSGEEWELTFHEQVFSDRERIMRHYLLESKGLYGCCNKLISRDLLGELCFRPYARGEDALFCTEFLCRCQTYAITERVVYCYLLRQGSATKQGFNSRSVDLPKAWEQIYERLAAELPAWKDEAARITLWQTDRIFAQGMEQKPDGWTVYRRELVRLHQRFAAMQPEADTLKKKLGRLLFNITPEGYYRIAGLHGRKRS